MRVLPTFAIVGLFLIQLSRLKAVFVLHGEVRSSQRQKGLRMVRKTRPFGLRSLGNCANTSLMLRVQLSPPKFERMAS